MKPHIVKKDVMIKMLDAEQAFTIYIVEKVAGYIVSARQKHFSGKFEARRMSADVPNSYLADWRSWEKSPADVLKSLRSVANKGVKS